MKKGRNQVPLVHTHTHTHKITVQVSPLSAYANLHIYLLKRAVTDLHDFYHIGKINLITDTNSIRVKKWPQSLLSDHVYFFRNSKQGTSEIAPEVRKALIVV